MDLLRDLVGIHSPSGEEFRMRDFLIEYYRSNASKFSSEPKLYFGDSFQDNLIVVFGKPKTAVFAHMDTIGFTCRYENQLVPIGGPEVKNGYKLSGADGMGPIECSLIVDDEQNLRHNFGRAIERGTSLIFKPEVEISREWIKGTYLDNRLGIYNALKVSEQVEDCAFVFSSFEEHGGGSVPMLCQFLYQEFALRNCLVSDITWVTDGVSHGEGTVISLRDQNIPRQRYLQQIISLADESGIPYQLEVEGSGSSDGREIHISPFPMDWCFIGAPEANVHSPEETVHRKDLDSMTALYIFLINKLR